MTTWQNDPPTASDFRSYQIVRTPSTGRSRLTILSTHPVGVMLHYWKGRSTPCNRNNCEPCKAGHRPRWKGYLYVMTEATRRILIFEYPERPHPDVQAELAKRHTLRGCMIAVNRAGKRANSPVVITFEGTTPHPDLLPEPDGLCETLERMWEIRQQPLEFLKDQALKEALEQRLNTPCPQPSNGQPPTTPPLFDS